MSDKPIAKCRRHLNEKDTLTVFSTGCHLWATPVYKISLLFRKSLYTLGPCKNMPKATNKR